MIYDYQRTLIKLTIIVLIAVFIVIRGSTAPLLLDNSIMRFLFYTPIDEDKTLYNIGIFKYKVSKEALLTDERFTTGTFGGKLAISLKG